MNYFFCKGRVIPVFLLVFIFQGCNVYHTGSVSVDDAVNSGKRVKIATSDNLLCEFKRLEKENDQLYGVTGSKSNTSRLLAANEWTRQGKNKRIKLDENEIRGYYLKNGKMSTAVNLGVPIISAAGLLGVTSKNFRPDIGN